MFYFFLITDLADLSEAPPLREQFSERSAKSVTSVTIFAFLTLNTPRSAHNKILGAKFSSFERARINGLYTVN